MKKTLLFICLSALVFTVYGRPMMPVEDVSDDYNPYEQSGSVVCAQMDEVATSEKPCCQGLEAGFGGKCTEPTIQDSSLTSCTTSASCSPGTACMPVSASDLFSPVSPSWEKPEVADLKEILNMQLADKDELKNIGESCSHAKECPSYSCVAGKCVERKVCRYARLKESPAPGQKCGAGYVLVNGFCDFDPKKKYPVFNDLIDSFEYTQVGNKCSSFKMEEEKEKEGMNSIKHLRALEWLIMGHTVDPYNDCYNLTQALRDDIMKGFYEGRKAATLQLAKNLKQIEHDSELLSNAKKYGDKTVIIHGTESLTGNELDTRLASGRDLLFLMMRRNSFFIQYEEAMFKLVEETSKKFEEMNKAVSAWGDNDNVWNMGTRTTHFKECSARYKIWKPIRWRWKDYGDTGNRWGFAYTLNPNKSDVKSILEKESILKPLAKIMNMSEEDIKSKLYLKPYNFPPFLINRTFLVDPLMHGGTKAQNYGKHTSDGHRGFLGLGRRDRHPYANDPNLSKMYSDRKQNFLDHIKAFGLGDKVNEEFELVPYMDAECLGKVAEGKECKLFSEHKKKFSEFVDDVMDISMAQFLAYSIRNQKNNFGYFSDASSGRSRFLISTIVNLGNVGSYYLASMDMQRKQNECLEKIINGIVDPEYGIYEPGGGVKEGEYYDPNLSTPGAVGNGTKPTSVKPTKGTQVAAGNIKSGLSKSILSGSTSSLGTVGGVGSGSSSSFGKGSSLSDQTLASFANRKNEMMKKNSLASSKGLKINSPKKDYADTVASMKDGDALSGSGKGGNSSGAGGGATSGFGMSSTRHTTHSSSIDEMSGSESLGSENSATATGDADGSAGAMTAGSIGAGTNTGVGLGGGYTAGGVANGSGDSTAGDAVSGLTDQTGLSEEEKNQMMAVYERTKHRYDSDGEDGIFEKVSKAYVRNLEKVLIRKKSID